MDQLCQLCCDIWEGMLSAQLNDGDFFSVLHAVWERLPVWSQPVEAKLSYVQGNAELCKSRKSDAVKSKPLREAALLVKLITLCVK